MDDEMPTEDTINVPQTQPAPPPRPSGKPEYGPGSEQHWDVDDFAPHKRYSYAEDPTGQRNAELHARVTDKNRRKGHRP